MPRKAEPTWELKKIVWEIAGRIGTNNLVAVQKQVDYEIAKRHRPESKEIEIFEDTPDTRKIKKIIEEDINSVPQKSLISELPSYIWTLRKDYDDILRLSEQSSTEKSDLKEHLGLTVERPSQFHFMIREIYNHDRDIFHKSNDILNEEKLEDFIVQLNVNEYYENQVGDAREFCKFFHYESNKYINTSLRNLAIELCDTLEKLFNFIEAYKIDEGRYYVVDPRDRFYADYVDIDNVDKAHSEWEKFDKEFSLLRDTTQRTYKTYRAAVRETLLI